MKFSESWLREWVNPNITTDELVEQLTMAGLEVDGVEPVAGQFSGVVVGEIMSAEQHPDADKLRVCSVRGLNNEMLSVVCGASNARVGIKVPFAMIGAILPGNFKIKKAKLRGVESFGMLCGQTELEAGDDDSGLWELPSDAPVGESLRTYLNLDDSVIEVDLTPNRSDCLGIQGLARETGVLNRADVAPLKFTPPATEIDKTVNVELLANEACPRYVGRVIEGVNVKAESPLWLQEKLRRSDIRPIDAVVDVTNYVLLELGQPMHAFDLNALSGAIKVRMASASEKITLLNDQIVELKDDTLVIADDSGPLAIAGVMGGAATAVSEKTVDLFLEAAFFHPIAIAGKARNYGLHTDSSHRFERGVDYELAITAMERVSQLIIDIAGGKAGPLVKTDLDKYLPEQRRVLLKRARIKKGLGFALPDADVVEILTRLGLGLEETIEEGWLFSVPSYRFDISIEADLLEELARIYGYNNLPTTINFVPQVLPSKSETVLTLDALSAQLVARAYNEIITYSFIDPEMHKLCFGDAPSVALLNPISADLSVMRTSLVPGLLQALKNNVKRQHERIRLFERGLRFQPNTDGLAQNDGLAGLLFGARDEQSWLAKKGEVDFYDIKGDVESLMQLSGLSYVFEPCQDLPYMHPGQTAHVVVQGKRVGYLGALHPEIVKALGLTKTPYLFELELSAILKSELPAYVDISRYPEVERDLAFLVDAAIPAADLEKAISSVAGENLKQLKVFDIYSGEGIDLQRKSIAFHLTFQSSSRTLTENEVNIAVDAVKNTLEGNFNATLR